MSLYPFYFTLTDDELSMTVFDREEFMVEVSARVIGGDLETSIEDVRLDGHSMVDSDDDLIRAIGRRVKLAATAELDGAGPLWDRVKDDYCLSFNDERGWRAA